MPIAVRNTNRPPQIDPIANQTVERGQSLQLLVRAVDPDGDPLALSASSTGGFGLPGFATFQDQGGGTAVLQKLLLLLSEFNMPMTYVDEVLAEPALLSRLVYLNLNKRPDAPLNPVFAELLRFVLSQQGQQITLNQGIFLPLRGFQADASYPIAGITPENPEKK